MSELVFDAAGNLYGTTTGGGAKFAVGTVFELSPVGGGAWTEKVLPSVPYGRYYQTPQTAVWFDAAGNIYGTTVGSDGPGVGSVFELTPNGDGSWSPKALHLFGGTGDGFIPAGLVGDANGNLFGTTASGGASNNGIVYELKKNASGQWIETVIHNFTGGADGEFPGTLTMPGQHSLRRNLPWRPRSVRSDFRNSLNKAKFCPCQGKALRGRRRTSAVR